MSDKPVFDQGLDDIAQEFLIESYENLDELDRALVALEKEPSSQPLLASIFRTIHTIKGTSGFLAFSRLEAVTHVGENVLSKLRDGKLALTPQITTVLLQRVDAVRALLANIERTGAEGEMDTSAVEEALARCLDADPARAPVPAPRAAQPPAQAGPATTTLPVEQPDGVSAETSGDDDLEPDARRRPPRCSCKPAVDVTLRSAQKVWGSRTLTVILTGMGSDGLAGARSLRGVGGRVLAQDAATSVVWGMPGAVAREGLPELLPLDDVAPVILTAVEGTALATIAITNMTGMGAR